jgi:hypothetical protein
VCIHAAFHSAGVLRGRWHCIRVTMVLMAVCFCSFLIFTIIRGG